MTLRVLELYCGIGGCAAALAPAGDAARVVGALDVNHLALAVYRRNFPGHPAAERTLESIPAAELAGLGADLWWLSPPCQPFTRRGLGRDLDDPRTASLVALAERIGAVRPPLVALENVPGFAGSRTHRLLRDALDGAGYAVREIALCPTELGWPNRRRRFYLLASRIGWAEHGSGEEESGKELGRVMGGEVRARRAADEPQLARKPGGATAPKGGAESRGGAGPAMGAPKGAAYPAPVAGGSGPPVRVADLLDADPDPALAVDPALARRYAGALDVVEPGDPGAIIACFTAAYGRSPVRSGSYLVVGRDPYGEPRLRRFSPRETLRLLGFPPDFELPPDMPREVGWRLAGNSLSVPAVRAVLAALPGLEALSGAPRPRSHPRSYAPPIDC